MIARMNRAWLLVGTLVVVAVTGCSREGGRAPAPPPPPPAAPPPAALPTAPPASAPAAAPGALPAALTACKADADCAAVASDCCGCNAGGSQAAIARAKLDDFEAAKGARCGAAMCIALMSNHPTCSMKPGCVAGSCRLVQ
jgi:hypothetical protein